MRYLATMNKEDTDKIKGFKEIITEARKMHMGTNDRFVIVHDVDFDGLESRASWFEAVVACCKKDGVCLHGASCSATHIELNCSILPDR